MQNLIQELRRRNVFRVASLYAVGGWLLMQLAVVLETTLNLPGWFDTLITVLVLIGFPIVVFRRLGIRNDARGPETHGED